MNKSVSVFLPTRAMSERVKNKNTRIFAGIEGGLLKVKLVQLLDCSCIDEVILSTNDRDSIEVARKFKDHRKLKVIERPEQLALSTTNLMDLVNYVPKVCDSNHILWTHVTSPLVNTADYTNAVKTYFKILEQGFDSLMSVKEIQNFIWSKEQNKVVNKKQDDEKKWPRTQDLNKIYEVNSAIFMASKEVYMTEQDRIGKKPFLLTQNQIKSTDVDWEEDFKLAEILYENYK
ncbi:acylneuraminate cytidylyltransferase family protein [Psychroflexus sp. MES1-P1E]|uniref:acylneuraminate cytidylyltransferase family protein n=1 Tax=Psychroflexus sp. MES1-P1E TaxID=2058320 RepID=UPI000C7992B0|nr:acylneuraminate cytidylyltransferase [Psychroflexus sp. MES1-P1E]PKG43431.1 acylneuraminate cytidylyltransferase [Psychroflexus sp. MES1-P1E]